MSNKRTNKKTTSTETPVESVEIIETPTVELVDESTEREPYFDMVGLVNETIETPTAEIEAETTLQGDDELLFDASKFEPEAETLPPPPDEIIIDMSTLPETVDDTPADDSDDTGNDTPPVENKITSIAAEIRAMGVESNFDIIDTATKLDLISASILNPDVAFFRKSFGDKARKLHLRNYAPGYSLETFVEVGLAYHEYKSIVTDTNKVAWKPYANPLSYALLGMAVLTGREPGMPNGKYTKIGSSFGKHQTEAWAKWFYANETCQASTVKVEQAPVVKLETPAEPVAKAPVTTLPVETVESIDAELIEMIQSAVKPKTAPHNRKNNKAKAA